MAVVCIEDALSSWPAADVDGGGHVHLPVAGSWPAAELAIEKSREYRAAADLGGRRRFRLVFFGDREQPGAEGVMIVFAEIAAWPCRRVRRAIAAGHPHHGGCQTIRSAVIEKPRFIVLLGWRLDVGEPVARCRNYRGHSCSPFIPTRRIASVNGSRGSSGFMCSG